jgi:hypothetical protein
MDETQNIISIDIETLSTEPDGVILSIGACVVGTDKTFHAYCGIGRQLLNGRTISKDTHDWWLTQPRKQFKSEVCAVEKETISDALLGLYVFIHDSEDCLVYSKGAMDIYMLENAFRQYNLEIPWKFWNVRDLRTLIEDAKIDVQNLPFTNDNAHNALSDAIYQGKIIVLAREELNL